MTPPKTKRVKEQWAKRPAWKPSMTPPAPITRALGRATGDPIPLDASPVSGQCDWGDTPPKQIAPQYDAQVTLLSPIGTFYAVSPWLLAQRQATVIQAAARVMRYPEPRPSVIALLSGTSEHRAFHTIAWTTALLLSERLPVREGEAAFSTGEAKPWMLLGFGEWADQRLYETALPGEFVVRVPRQVNTPSSFAPPPHRFRAFYSKPFAPSPGSSPF